MKEKNKKEKDLQFIKGITSITVESLCKEEKIATANLYTLLASEKRIHNIKENIDQKIKKVYGEYDEQGNNSL